MIFDEFDVNTLIDNPSIIMIGGAGCGKIFVVKNLLYKMTDIPHINIIAPTNTREYYNDFIDPLFVHHEYLSSIPKQIVKRQRTLFEANKILKSSGLPLINSQTIFVMHDCMTTINSWRKCRSLFDIMHYKQIFKTTYILTVELSTGLNLKFRSTFDYTFLFAEDNLKSRQKLWNDWADIFPTFDSFEQAFLPATNKYGCLVIDNHAKTNDIKKKVFWFKATHIEDAFKFGIQNNLSNDLSDNIQNDLLDNIQNDLSDNIQNDLSDNIQNDLSDNIQNDLYDNIQNDLSDKKYIFYFSMFFMMIFIYLMMYLMSCLI